MQLCLCAASRRAGPAASASPSSRRHRRLEHGKRRAAPSRHLASSRAALGAPAAPAASIVWLVTGAPGAGYHREAVYRNRRRCLGVAINARHPSAALVVVICEHARASRKRGKRAALSSAGSARASALSLFGLENEPVRLGRRTTSAKSATSASALATCATAWHRGARRPSK